MPKGSPKDTYYTWTKAFREKGAKVILDADGDLLKAGLKASPYLIKPNNHELGALTGRALETPEEMCIRDSLQSAVFGSGQKPPHGKS